MIPENELMRKIEDALFEYKEKYSIVEYSKVDEEQFLKLPELGVYYQASKDSLITSYRIYYIGFDDFFPAPPEARGRLKDIYSIEDALKKLGAPVKKIPSIRIPGINPTSPGYQFILNEKTISFYYDPDTEVIRFVHTRIN
ncbi:hypothetical protein ALQ33_03556 [Pseudomonas syringae pv. philadelphi]|uniref:Uncharacterized protein n=1 Tax=Pseudomonas syringae pv. philadelphi TaxID=251706 RepID=A0A3M3Z9Q0_9PSED|nr:hypothetical protein [Pseudomonas syringae group genomosp. 3]RMO90725.1 hypothetical protein ALQ33_03556 [Pseudomonas syringae pv. philadelphi]